MVFKALNHLASEYCLPENVCLSLCIVTLRVSVYRGLKVVPTCTNIRQLPIHFSYSDFRHFCCRPMMYRLATKYTEKNEQTTIRQVDAAVMCCIG